ncbi:MAG: hypothetical protein QXY99_02650 [Thermoproteota archaeon]
MKIDDVLRKHIFIAQIDEIFSKEEFREPVVYLVPHQDLKVKCVHDVFILLDIAGFKDIFLVSPRWEKFCNMSKYASSSRIAESAQSLHDELRVCISRLVEFAEIEGEELTAPSVVGTPARICRYIVEKEPDFGWFPPFEGEPYPLTRDELEVILEVHGELTLDRLKELAVDPLSFNLPTPEQVEEKFKFIGDFRSKLSESRDLDDVVSSISLTDQQVMALETFVNDLEDVIEKNNAYASCVDAILRHLLTNGIEAGDTLYRDTEGILSILRHHREVLNDPQIEFIDDVPLDRFGVDAQKRLHYLKTRWFKGFWIFTPKVIRETQYVEDVCLVNGEKPKNISLLEKVVAVLNLSEEVTRFHSRVGITDMEYESINDAIEKIGLIRDIIKKVIYITSRSWTAIEQIPRNRRVELCNREGRKRWLAAVKSARLRVKLRDAEEVVERWKEGVERYLRAVGGETNITELMKRALNTMDVTFYTEAWAKLRELEKKRISLLRYENVMKKLYPHSLVVASLVRISEGDPSWTERFRYLEEAWNWRRTKGWFINLRSFSEYTTLQCETLLLMRTFYGSMLRRALSRVITSQTLPEDLTETRCAVVIDGDGGFCFPKDGVFTVFVTSNPDISASLAERGCKVISLGDITDGGKQDTVDGEDIRNLVVSLESCGYQCRPIIGDGGIRMLRVARTSHNSEVFVLFPDEKNVRSRKFWELYESACSYGYATSIILPSEVVLYNHILPGRVISIAEGRQSSIGRDDLQSEEGDLPLLLYKLVEDFKKKSDLDREQEKQKAKVSQEAKGKEKKKIRKGVTPAIQRKKS